MKAKIPSNAWHLATIKPNKSRGYEMIKIEQLDYEKYKGQQYEAVITSSDCYEITKGEKGFTFELMKLDEVFRLTIKDEMLSTWLEEPTAFGAFGETGKLLGFVEGFLERWNNRYRITNICVFEDENRRNGIGQLLFDAILDVAKASGARMAVLETQNANVNAINFYQRNAFEVIGFDLYAYSNNGPKEHNVRVEMGRKL